jgi:hypothetical protein
LPPLVRQSLFLFNCVSFEKSDMSEASTPSVVKRSHDEASVIIEFDDAEQLSDASRVFADVNDLRVVRSVAELRGVLGHHWELFSTAEKRMFLLDKMKNEANNVALSAKLAKTEEEKNALSAKAEEEKKALSAKAEEEKKALSTAVANTDAQKTAYATRILFDSFRATAG